MRRFGCIALATLAVTLCVQAEEDLEKAAAAREKAQRDVYAKMPATDEAGFERLGDPGKGGWLSLVAEMPETLDDYKKSRPVRATVERHMIVLQPLGKLDAPQQELLAALKEYVAAYFQLPARIEAPIELNIKGLTRSIQVDRFKRRTEYDGDKFLDPILLNKLPDDAAIYFGFTDVDLYVGSDNVHGYASLKTRVGLMTLNRLWPKSAAKFDAAILRRTCRFASHEIGHMFGLSHCVFYRCAMNGCKNLAESEGSPLHYCPVCRQKMQWLLEPDTQKRNAALHAFYVKYGLKEEAAWTAIRMKANADERR